MTTIKDDKLKLFLVAELRSKGFVDLARIINHSKVEYNTPYSYTTDLESCYISISIKEDFDYIQKDTYKFKDTIKPIVSYAKNISSSFNGYPLQIIFQFDLNNWEDTDIMNINEDVGDLEADKIKMIDKYSSGDYDGALTSAKSFLESVFKTYLDSKDISYDKKNEKFSPLGGKVFKEISKGKADHYNKVIGGIKMICYAINESRNEDGDGHGKPAQDRNEIDKSTLKVIIETAISIGHFIIKSE